MDKMQNFRTKIHKSYWEAKDLEEKQRDLLVDFLKNKKWKVLELGCWNGKVLAKIFSVSNELDLYWIDYNEDMVKQARIVIPQIKGHLEVWDMLDALKMYENIEFDFVFCLNSLHNLPDRGLIYKTIEIMKKLTKQWWYIIFDVRNSWNPFVNYWYRKNRKRGLKFFTLDSCFILRRFFWDCHIVSKMWIHYKSLQEAWFTGGFLKRIIYKAYLLFTKIYLFSPYQFLILKK